MTDNNEKKYLRMTFNERIQHFFLLTSFITLVITGFALVYPEAFWVRWARYLLGDTAFELRGIVHRVAAVIMVIDSFYHIIYVTFTKRGRTLIKDMWFSVTDLTDLKNVLNYFTGKTKERPKFRRFSYIEKAEYWALVWGTIVMSMTGIILWFENFFLPVVSTGGMDIATAIHFYEAILASLAIVVWHFYFVIYNPDVYPMSRVWIKGYMTREEMEHEHPLELEALEAEMDKKEVSDDENNK
jgi:formate dehydrogenase gamma subunit